MNLKEVIYEYFQTNQPNSLVENTDFHDFSAIEQELGFKLHPDLQAYFGSYYFDEIEGILASSKVPATEKWGHWFEFNHEFKLPVSLHGPERGKDMKEQIMRAYQVWTGGYDFGQRFWIGEIFANIGQILLVFNNETGTVEWIDTDYGSFGNLEQDPNGIFTPTLADLIVALDGSYQQRR